MHLCQVMDKEVIEKNHVIDRIQLIILSWEKTMFKEICHVLSRCNNKNSNKFLMQTIKRVANTLEK